MGIYNVRPLRTNEEIKDMLWAIQKTSRRYKRDMFLFKLGINTGLRVSDLVRLTVKDMSTQRPRIQEKKRKKKRTLFLESIWEDVQEYTAGKKPEEYLFQSQKGDNKPLSTVAVYQMLDKAAKLLERDDVGTHTMRKTFGYHYYKATKDIASLMDIFNHSDQNETKKYIEIHEDDLAESMKGFRLG
ncbi:tyrosine-type recombinase/integrase [Bacillus cereus group sp. MYBK15-3]|uniref:tyrosine-type recombinase/integrase n=2 Tax=Bacillus TaxID=1386 RepID=UPI001879F8B0|nr:MULTISPECIES: tyrosine-type recombinase/integrase [Bacillus cereus group]MBE7114238.1 tyrosine-type recombinase/integrase [Bacillus paranthracis]MBE7154889.1 tyrosine-type recombinase/integrase [Bacillus paranthracis]MBX9158743.1 tyrosine-type recombinase/integrase [Bacillus cereus]